jgi:hypothetical protein
LRQVHRNDPVPETGSDVGIEVVDKAQEALSQANGRGQRPSEAKRVALEKRLEAEETRWEK